jgi:hypothetical protein
MGAYVCTCGSWHGKWETSALKVGRNSEKKKRDLGESLCDEQSYICNVQDSRIKWSRKYSKIQCGVQYSEGY